MEDEDYTFRRGYTKIHPGCGGSVRIVESLDPDCYREWEYECRLCGKVLKEEEILINNKFKDVGEFIRNHIEKSKRRGMKHG